VWVVQEVTAASDINGLYKPYEILFEVLENLVLFSLSELTQQSLKLDD